MNLVIVDLGVEPQNINNRLLAVKKAAKKYPNRLFYVFWPEALPFPSFKLGLPNISCTVVDDTPTHHAAKYMQLMRENGHKCVLVSAGDTGKLVVKAIRYLGRKPDFTPVLASIWPKRNGEILALDVGGHKDAFPTPEQLSMQIDVARQFCTLQLAKDSPRFAILNIGEEENKGTDWHKEARELCIDKLNQNFIGFIEPHRIFDAHNADIILTPGFIGNIMLKTAEGVLGILINIVGEQKQNKQWHLVPFAYLFLILYRVLFKRWDWHRRGWAILLGFDATIIKAHSRVGRSFYYALGRACTIHKS